MLEKFAQAARNQLMDQVRQVQPCFGKGRRDREAPQAVRNWRRDLLNGREQVAEQIAYTWFNWFIALASWM